MIQQPMKNSPRAQRDQLQHAEEVVDRRVADPPVVVTVETEQGREQRPMPAATGRTPPARRPGGRGRRLHSSPNAKTLTMNASESPDGVGEHQSAAN